MMAIVTWLYRVRIFAPEVHLRQSRQRRLVSASYGLELVALHATEGWGRTMRVSWSVETLLARTLSSLMMATLTMMSGPSTLNPGNKISMSTKPRVA